MSAHLHCARCGRAPWQRLTVTLVNDVPTCSECATLPASIWTEQDREAADAYNKRRATLTEGASNG